MALNFRPYPAPQQRDRGRNIGAAADSLSRALLYLMQGQQQNKRLSLEKADRKRRIGREDIAATRADTAYAQKQADRRYDLSQRPLEEEERRFEAKQLPFDLRKAEAQARLAETKADAPPPETPQEKFLREQNQTRVSGYLNLDPKQRKEFGPDILPGANIAAESLGGEIFQPTREQQPGRFGRAVNKYKKFAQSADPLEMFLGSRAGQYVPESAQTLLRAGTFNPASELAGYLPDFKSKQVPTGVPIFRGKTAEPRAVDRGTTIPRPGAAGESSPFGTQEEVLSAFAKKQITRDQAKILLRKFGVQ